jgi:hypothetical protein
MVSSASDDVAVAPVPANDRRDAIDRPAGMPIPSRLNVLLVVSVATAAVACFRICC